MSSPSPAERRLLLTRLLTTALDAYERGDLGLARLVSDVEQCVDGLFEVADEVWVDELRSAWGHFEIVYAGALADGRTGLNEEDHEQIAAGIAELRSLVASGPPSAAGVMSGIEITSGGDGELPHLSEVLDAVPPHIRRMGWTVFDLWAVGHDDRLDVGELEDRSADAAGLRVDDARLVELGVGLLQAIDGFFVASPPVGTTGRDADVQAHPAFVLQVFDSTFWRVWARDDQDLGLARAAFPGHRLAPDGPPPTRPEPRP
jgi:hypothetical protein